MKRVRLLAVAGLIVAVSVVATAAPVSAAVRPAGSGDGLVCNVGFGAGSPEIRDENQIDLACYYDTTRFTIGANGVPEFSVLLRTHFSDGSTSNIRMSTNLHPACQPNESGCPVSWAVGGTSSGGNLPAGAFRVYWVQGYSGQASTWHNVLLAEGDGVVSSCFNYQYFVDGSGGSPHLCSADGGNLHLGNGVEFPADPWGSPATVTWSPCHNLQFLSGLSQSDLTAQFSVGHVVAFQVYTTVPTNDTVTLVWSAPWLGSPAGTPVTWTNVNLPYTFLWTATGAGSLSDLTVTCEDSTTGGNPVEWGAGGAIGVGPSGGGGNCWGNLDVGSVDVGLFTLPFNPVTALASVGNAIGCTITWAFVPQDLGVELGGLRDDAENHVPFSWLAAVVAIGPAAVSGFSAGASCATAFSWNIGGQAINWSPCDGGSGVATGMGISRALFSVVIWVALGSRLLRAAPWSKGRDGGEPG